MGIPCETYGQSGTYLHFGHANGYPPSAYRKLLDLLAARYKIVAMRMRPLWTSADPSQIQDWRPLADDLLEFLHQQGMQQVVSIGHSMGATTALRLAMRYPAMFSALVLIDPVLFLPHIVHTMRLIHTLGLSYRLHPLVSSALHRRRTFESEQAMFENYRTKPIFSRMNDDALWDYVHSLARTTSSGTVELEYTPEWEARIYVTGVLADMDIWRALKTLQPPLLLIRGQLSTTFREECANRIQNYLPDAQVRIITDATHLVALEKPEQVSRVILDFLQKLTQ